MINYKDKVFIRSYTHDEAKLYACFHPEVLIMNGQYENTGRYFVVLLYFF